MGLVVRPLHGALGAEVSGIALRNPLTREEQDEIAGAWERFGVLVFPGQVLSDEEHVAFSRQFGNLELFPQRDNRHGTVPEILRASNVGENGCILPLENPATRYLTLTQVWHTDSSYREIPSRGTILHGIEVTARGGETCFANMKAAFEALPDDWRAEIETLRARHSLEYSRTLCDLPPLRPEERAMAPPVEHKLVRSHFDGSRSLYLSPAEMECIVARSPEASRLLIDRLTEFATREEFVHRHRWRSHDVLMWDNRWTMHKVSPFDWYRERRVMHRTVIAGTEPVL